MQPLNVGRHQVTQLAVFLPFARNLFGGAIGVLAVDEVTADYNAVWHEIGDKR
jgi:hypothetical protein